MAVSGRSVQKTLLISSAIAGDMCLNRLEMAGCWTSPWISQDCSCLWSLARKLARFVHVSHEGYPTAHGVQLGCRVAQTNQGSVERPRNYVSSHHGGIKPLADFAIEEIASHVDESS